MLPKRYSSPSLVASGGMGEVYRATDTVLGRTVAVKVLSERHSREEEARARFRREALAAARVSGSKHVVTIFDVGEHRGRPLIVMEYVDGGSVHDRLRQGPVPPEQALAWLEQAAEALDRAHAEGIVHRDVKPANLLLDGEGSVHVSDFGIASTAGVDTLTLPGTVLGTAGYLSPEQARGEPATPASDRYALGVVAFELLTGRRPFASDTATTEAFAHLHAPVPSARSLAPELPPAVDAVLRRALAKDPDERPGSCAELVAELRAAFAEEAAVRDQPLPAAVIRSVPPTRRLHRVRRVPRRPRIPAAPGLLAVAAVSAVVLLVAATRNGGEDTRSAAERPPAETTTKRREISEPPPTVDGAALNDEGYRLMQAGRYEEALPLLRQAVLALRGTGSLTEAYAAYNLAYTRFALGSCDGVIGLLDRSERIQGDREEIDDLRGRWEERCGTPAGGDEDDGPGKGKGKGRGKGND